MRTLGYALSAIAVAVLTSCGSGRPIDFPQPDSTPVSSLSASELQAMCLQMSYSTLPMLRDALCTSSGLQAAFTGKGSCESVRSACLTTRDDKYDPAKTCSNIDQADLSRLANCNITVGEYEACANDLVRAVQSTMGSLSCTSTIEELSKLTNYSNPASCTQLQSRCPGLGFGGVSSSGSGSGGDDAIDSTDPGGNSSPGSPGGTD